MQDLATAGREVAADDSREEKTSSGSVIAACIARFRYQEPTSPKTRPRLSRDEFFWLDANSRCNNSVASNSGEIRSFLHTLPVSFHMSEDGWSSFKTDEDSKEGHDNTPKPGILVKAVHTILSNNDLPLLHGCSNSDIISYNDSVSIGLGFDAAEKLDAYANNLLKKCDQLLLGFEQPNDHTRSVSSSLVSAQFNDNDHNDSRVSEDTSSDGDKEHDDDDDDDDFSYSVTAAGSMATATISVETSGITQTLKAPGSLTHLEGGFGPFRQTSQSAVLSSSVLWADDEVDDGAAAAVHTVRGSLIDPVAGVMSIPHTERSIGGSVTDKVDEVINSELGAALVDPAAEDGPVLIVASSAAAATDVAAVIAGKGRSAQEQMVLDQPPPPPRLLGDSVSSDDLLLSSSLGRHNATHATAASSCLYVSSSSEFEHAVAVAVSSTAAADGGGDAGVQMPQPTRPSASPAQSSGDAVGIGEGEGLFSDDDDDDAAPLSAADVTPFLGDGVVQLLWTRLEAVRQEMERVTK